MHDWMSHRSIQCTICTVMLDCRQDIESHRKSVHDMFRKVPCRYSPECFYEDECQFFHTSSVNDGNCFSMGKIVQTSLVHSASKIIKA